MKFKVGDKVKVIPGHEKKCSSYNGYYTTGNYLIIDKVDSRYSYRLFDVAGKEIDYCWCFKDEDLELVETITNKIMTNIKTFIKNLTRTEPELTLVKAGFLNDNEELTTDGKEALDYIVYQANKQALKDLADKIVAEQEKESK